MTTRKPTPTLGACSCRPDVQRDNCPQCEGTGRRIDFRALRSMCPRCGFPSDCDAHKRLCEPANARLIAAAPEMLAALKAAEGVVDWALDNGAHPGAREVHRLITAAIAKAKGEP